MDDYIRGMLAIVLGFAFLLSLGVLGLGLFRAFSSGNWFLAIVYVVLWLVAVRCGMYINRVVDQSLSDR
ncbi:hypothetical protein IQ268_24075 [Oculatella sp. LEGE 06141]|uniref:hypothetical protein n=1 Tax=Oculatella sp. LEGE 06141 TaxID=1828648 RepID=UPI001882AA38|nr:hypothetical protein [Oculatella sp. LEGE 06141]MBE9181646.1 hypothetical protein [Oculatella sp. LEGE 06141]